MVPGGGGRARLGPAIPRVAGGTGLLGRGAPLPIRHQPALHRDASRRRRPRAPAAPTYAAPPMPPPALDARDAHARARGGAVAGARGSQRAGGLAGLRVGCAEPHGASCDARRGGLDRGGRRVPRGGGRARRPSRAAVRSHGRGPAGPSRARPAPARARSHSPVVCRVPLRGLHAHAAAAIRPHAVLRPVAAERRARERAASRGHRPEGAGVSRAGAAISDRSRSCRDLLRVRVPGARLGRRCGGREARR